MMGPAQRRLLLCTMTSEPLLCLLYCTLTVGAVKVVVKTPSIQVTRGGSVLLPCSFRTTAALNRLNIIWTVSPLLRPQQPLQVISYEQGQIVESLSDYLGRVTFAFQPTQDASIVLNQSRESDTGTYQCTVINPPDGATPNIGLIGLTVLVPPSIPDCSSDGHGQEGGSIQLRCSVKEGIPTPRIRWEKTPPSAHRLISTQEDYRGSITLSNLTSETSGLYRCTVTNQLGSQTCAVELHIRVGGLGSMGIFAAITMTLIMGLVLLALFILVLCLHQQSRGKWKEQVYSVRQSQAPLHHTMEVSTIKNHQSRVPMYPNMEVSTIKNHQSRVSPHRTMEVSTINNHQSRVSPHRTMEGSTISNHQSRVYQHRTMEGSTINNHQSRVPMYPNMEVSTISNHQSRVPMYPNTEVSTTTSEESSTGIEEEEDHSPARHSSIYSIHSGYLV